MPVNDISFWRFSTKGSGIGCANQGTLGGIKVGERRKAPEQRFFVATATVPEKGRRKCSAADAEELAPVLLPVFLGSPPDNHSTAE